MSHPPIASVGAHAVKATILVVDDSAQVQRYLRTLLELESYRVEVAGSGYEALASLRNSRVPDVMILDLQMPGMDGLETLRQLQNVRPKPKVIMCSGVDDPGKIQEALSLGAQTYLVKPIRHLYLSAAVDRCLHEVPAKRPIEHQGAQLFVLPSLSCHQLPLFRQFKS